MAQKKFITCDGNYAAAHIAYMFSEVAAIYPITPSSTMAEYVDEWAASGRKNIFGETVKVVEMRSEAGAAGAVHGSLQSGALTDDVHGLAGTAADDSEHVQDIRRAAAGRVPRFGPRTGRAVAVDFRRPSGRDGHPPDRFRRNAGDEQRTGSDGPGRRRPDPVAIRSRVPFLPDFFDGFRTSHEVRNIEMID